jgi:hypothetical protein
MKRLMMVLLAAVFVAAGYGQGMYWESTITIPGQNQQEKLMKTFYLPKKMKTISEGENEYRIIRIDQEKVYSVNVAEKTYSEMTFAEIEASGKQTEQQMAKLKEQMNAMPAEQRKMMEKMLGANTPGKTEATYKIVKTGEKKIVSGFACTRCSMMQNEKEIASLWVTQDVKGYAAMRQDMMEQIRRMSMLKGLAEAMSTLDGFPIEMDMTQGVKTLVTKVEHRAIAASEFEIPAGFTKVEQSTIPKKEGK